MVAVGLLGVGAQRTAHRSESRAVAVALVARAVLLLRRRRRPDSRSRLLNLLLVADS